MLKGGTRMPYQRKARKVYYHVLRGSRFIIADECNKKKLLDVIRAIQQQEGWSIYAFCLMDDSAYLVTEADDGSSICRGSVNISERFLQMCGETLQCLSGSMPVICPGEPEELTTLSEIAARCRQIHWIPQNKGYVMKLRDYWWSSYITYTGQYDWELVDCSILSGYFSDDPDQARIRLKQFHQQRSTLDIT
jgi:hypothetical protein